MVRPSQTVRSCCMPYTSLIKSIHVDWITRDAHMMVRSDTAGILPALPPAVGELLPELLVLTSS